MKLKLEDTDRGVTVTRVLANSNEFMKGKLHVGDRIVGIAESQGDSIEVTDEISAMDALVLMAGPYRSDVRITVENEQLERREVLIKRIVKVDPRPIRICFSPNNKTIAIAGQRTGTTSLNTVTGQTKRYPYFSNSVAISHDNRLLAMDSVVNASEDVVVWDLLGDKLHSKLSNLSQPVLDFEGGSVCFSPDGKFLAMANGYPYFSAARQTKLTVWRNQDGKRFGDAAEFKNDRVFSDLAFTPDSSHLIATDHAGRVRVWNTDTWDLDSEFSTGATSFAIAISSDGKTLAAGGSEQTQLWDLENAKQLPVAMRGPTPWALDFSPDGKTLVSGSNNHNVILWDVATGMQLRTFHAHSDAVKGVAFSPDGDTLATVGTDGVLRLWEAATFEEIESHPTTVQSISRQRSAVPPDIGEAEPQPKREP